MKFIVRTSLLLLVCLSVLPIYAQKRASKPKTKAVSVTDPRTICQGEAVPKGFVVVEAQRSSRCVELTIKKPAASEVVCDGSPIPDGYSVIKQDGTRRCSAVSPNPLTNALVISNGDTTITPSAKARARTSDEDEEIIEPSIRVTVSRNEQSEGPKSVLEKRALEAQRQAREAAANLGPSGAEIETAIRRSTVILGMQPQDVDRAWGSSHTNDNLYENGLQITIWSYKRGEVHFRNGVVYSVSLLKN